MPSRARYDTALTDAQFAAVEPLLPARKAGGAIGRRPSLPWCEILDAILYILRTGAAWRHMPHNLVNWHSAYHYFRLWSRDGTWVKIHDMLRSRVREAEGRKECQIAAIIDSQSSKTTLKGGITWVRRSEITRSPANR